MCLRYVKAFATVGLVVMGGLANPAHAQSDGNPGAYLAAQSALDQHDFASAAQWFEQALLADPENPLLLKGLTLTNLSLGKVEEAARSAKALAKQGKPGQIDYLASVAGAARASDFQAVLDITKQNPSGGALLMGLLTAWADLGQGRMSEALDGFDTLATTEQLSHFALYHKALALASAGDFQSADNILSGKASGPIAITRRGVVAHLQILSQLERNADALAILERSFGAEPDPLADDLRRRLQAGEPLPFDMARNAADGMAEAFFTLATALNGQAEDAYTLIYARIAADLRSDNADASLLSAGLLERLGQHDLATGVYGQVPAGSPLSHIAEMGRADAAYATGRKDAAIEIMQTLARTHPRLLVVQVGLGDMLRREERFTDARAAYDAAVALLPKPEANHWPIFFSRGICAERSGDFDGAVADLRQALALNPNQPEVLNYLGYSFVDRGENLDEALGMIQRAVLAEPESGMIIDSLAWAFFRLGRYDDAVVPMERASLLEPVDPIVTDHLGDVYWKVGRLREAEFQWHRALSFKPTDSDAVRIRSKLERGLDAVMAEEAAAEKDAPKAAANGG